VLRDSQAAMLATAIGGPADADYRRARDAFLAQLIERARVEERHIGTDLIRTEDVGGQAMAAAAPGISDQWWADSWPAG
jgi:hypothetical protein